MHSGKLFQESTDGRRALRGLVQKIEAEFEEDFARFGFAPRVFEQRRNIRQAKGDTDARERPLLRHDCGGTRIPQSLRAAGVRRTKPADVSYFGVFNRLNFVLRALGAAELDVVPHTLV